VKDLIAGSGISFEDRGEHELREVPDGWPLLRVIDPRAVPLPSAETSRRDPALQAASRVDAHPGNAGYRGRSP
jgi:hypothetical protein